MKSFIYIFPVLIFTISEKFKTMFSDGEKLVELSSGEVFSKIISDLNNLGSPLNSEDFKNYKATFKKNPIKEYYIQKK